MADITIKADLVHVGTIRETKRHGARIGTVRHALVRGAAALRSFASSHPRLVRRVRFSVVMAIVVLLFLQTNILSALLSIPFALFG